MAEDLRLREKWPWHWEILRFGFWISMIMGIALAVVYYPKMGRESLWFLIFALTGLLFVAVYSFVGKKNAESKGITLS